MVIKSMVLKLDCLGLNSTMWPPLILSVFLFFSFFIWKIITGFFFVCVKNELMNDYL